MKKPIALLVVLLVLFAQPLAVFAAGNESLHENYITDVFNEENGLPTGEANTLVQTRDGYLWIGSYGGLIRHDGSTFVDFSANLASSAIRALFEASDGTLYIGTNDAGAYAFKDDVFTPLRAEDEHLFLCIRDFAEGPDGTIYVASPSGVAKIVENTLVAYTYRAFSGEQFLNVAVDRFGNVWAMASSGMTYILDDDQLYDVCSSDEFFEDSLIYTVAADADGNILIGSSGNEIVKIEFDATKEPHNIEAHKKTYYSTGDVTTINRLKVARDGTILVSSLNGFGVLDKNGRFERIDKEQETNLSANWAELDHEGNRWVASSNFGVIRYSVGCFDSCNYNSNLGEIFVNAVTKSGDRFYVATDTGVLVFDEDWNPVTNRLTEEIQGFRVRNAVTDGEGRVWFATYSSYGALCYDPKTDEIKGYGVAEGLNSEIVRVVYPLSDGRMLVGNQLGVNIIENGAVTEKYTTINGMETTSVLCAMEIGGRILVGTDGSGIYEIANGRLINYAFASGLTQGVVLRMAPDADGNGNYFVCAGDKLFYGENDTFRELTGIAKGSGSIYSVYDVDGRIWILQNGGVFSADKAGVLAGEDVYTARYGVKCGMTGTLSANTWNYLDDTGALYMPTRNGVSLFYFRGADVITPHAIVNSITVDDVVYEHPTALELESGAQRVTVDISSLLFADTSEFILGYMLDGFDTAETFTTEKHVTQSYTNLPGGNYTLKMRIINPLTGESTAERDVTITKQMRLTEHSWFWALLVAAGAGLAFAISALIIRSRTKKAEQRQRELQNIIDQSLTTISSTIDAKDEYTKGHSVRVAMYAREIAKRMGMSEEEQQRIYYIGLLHDIGKIGVPDSVLNKRGKLTDDEFAFIRRHPAMGGDILKNFNALKGIGDGARYHHERYDGRGYCEGLAGKDIPIEARIIGIADSYDAMQSTRVYRPGLTPEVILNELKKGAGTQFDPDIVPIMCQMIDEGVAPIEYSGAEYEMK